jgi:rhamnosyltransferase
MQLGRLSAITVTYNPNLADGRLEQQLREVRSHVELHLLVDNGSQNADRLEALVSSIDRGEGRTRLVRLGSNLGIGDAINRGVATLQAEHRAEWILLLDQDTGFYPDSFDQLGRELSGIEAGDRIAVIGFNYRTHHFNREGSHNPSGRPAAMRMTITSGSLVRASILAEQPLDGGLYLYAVDTEYCYRLRNRGYEILVLAAAAIDHRESERLVVNGAPRWFLQPYRLFYVTRNSFTVSSRYSSLRPALFSLYLVYMNLVAHVDPRASTGYAFRGFLAFLRGDRTGPAPAQSP